MQFIQFATENILILIIMASGLLFSAIIGFLGLVIGIYRTEVGQWSLYHFALFYLEKEKELWVAHHRDGLAVTVGLLVFGHAGLVLGPMFAISKAKKVETLPVIDRRKVTHTK